MIPTKQQLEAIQRLSTGQDGALLISFYKEVIRYYADVRNLKDPSSEEVRARQLACLILEEELIGRLTRNQDTNKKITKEEYE